MNTKLRARAIAYLASNDVRHYRDLTQHELEQFWGEVSILRQADTIRKRYATGRSDHGVGR